MKSIINLIILLFCSMLSNAQTNLNILSEIGFSKLANRYLVGIEVGEKDLHSINLTLDNIDLNSKKELGLGYQFSKEVYCNLRIEAGMFIRFGQINSAYIDSGAFAHFCPRYVHLEENIGLSYQLLKKYTKPFSTLPYIRVSAVQGLGKVPSPCNETQTLFYPSVGVRVKYKLSEK